MFGQWMVKSKEQDNYINLILQMKKQGVSFKILPLQVIEDPTKSGLKFKKKITSYNQFKGRVIPWLANLSAQQCHQGPRHFLSVSVSPRDCKRTLYPLYIAA